MNIEKFKQNYNVCKYRLNECIKSNNDNYKIRKEFFIECIMFYEKINNVLNMQEIYLNLLKEIINNNTINNKKIRENVINHRIKLKDIEKEIENVICILEFKLNFNKNSFDFYDNSKSNESNIIYELMLQCYNLTKLLEKLIESFKLYNNKFYFEIKIIEKKINNNYLLIISV